ncbi:glycosyltransferase family A protein [Salinicola halophyticus]|uniref:glycosyltransferase family A protein n=1 Tax=Salinicola halophyticus TaxID=1808881 RepID=UPI003F46002D
MEPSPPTSRLSACPRFYFGIPLRSRQASFDWPLVCRNLERTLLSLKHQTCGDFGILVACHEIPDVDTFDLDIEFIVADFDPPPAVDDEGRPGNDKPKKKRMVGLAMKARMADDGYYLQLDADDLIHPDLVNFTLADDNRRGYLIERGYMFDCCTGQFGQMDQEHSPFWRHCGSCAVVYFTKADMPDHLMDNRCYFNQFKRHREYVDIAAARGQPLVPYPEPMAIYLINHGENDISMYRGKKGVKSEYVRRSLVEDPDEISKLVADYPQLSEFLRVSE